MIQVFRDFQENILTQHPLFQMSLFLKDIPRGHHKRTQYLSAAFIADLSTLFTAQTDSPSAIDKHLEMKSASIYITHELLDNSIKFNNRQVDLPIEFKVCLVDRILVFAASNSVDATVLANFREFMERLEMSDLEELYFCQLEQGAEENSHSSRLGFLSMMTDYGAKLGWKVETLEGDPEVAIVTTMVQLSI